MSNYNFFLFILLFYIQHGFCQLPISANDTIIYVTYYKKNLPYHEVSFTQDKIRLEVFSKYKLGGGSTPWKELVIKNDTLSLQSPGTVSTSNFGEFSIMNDFDAPRFISKSDTMITMLNTHRPYFKKSIVDSIIGEDQVVYAAKNKVIRAPADFNEFSEITHLFEKPKKVKLRKLDGEQGFEKYGVIGIKGVLEFYEKKKCKMKKK